MRQPGSSQVTMRRINMVNRRQDALVRNRRVKVDFLAETCSCLVQQAAARCECSECDVIGSLETYHAAGGAIVQHHDPIPSGFDDLNEACHPLDPLAVAAVANILLTSFT